MGAVGAEVAVAPPPKLAPETAEGVGFGVVERLDDEDTALVLDLSDVEVSALVEAVEDCTAVVVDVEVTSLLVLTKA